MSIARLPIFILAIGMTFSMASAASAVTIDCDDVGCIGGSYTLVLEETSADLWTATYTVDTTGDFSVDAAELVNVEFKVAKSYTDVQVSTVSVNDMDFDSAPLSGQGCNTQSKNTSFICVELAPHQAIGDVYNYTITFVSDSVLDEADWHLVARYESDDPESRKPNGWVISLEPGSAVPEPTAALLFGAGVLVAGSAGRRSRD